MTIVCVSRILKFENFILLNFYCKLNVFDFVGI